MLKISNITTRLGKKHFKKGDEILSFSGDKAEDLLDYFYFDSETNLSCDVCRGKKIKTLHIKKQEDASLGLEFAPECELSEKQCHNKCIFCFVDQLPKNMRETLYGKDDDYRFSFLMGNYVTMTNHKTEDIDRIIKRRFSPIYVSVHATDSELRKKILHNRFAGELFPQLKRLTENGIVVHSQIVLMENINDGDMLEKTLSDLYSLGENLASVAIVPVGLTGHREGLYPLEKLSKECIAKSMEIVKKYQEKTKGEDRYPFVFPSDEMYLQGGLELPSYEEYNDFPQIENGVGLVRKYQREFEEEQEFSQGHEISNKKTLFATGVVFAPILKEMLESVSGLDFEVAPIKNKFFGESITVSGLLVGRDILAQTKDKIKEGNFQRLFVPKQSLKEFDDVFLDDMPLSALQAELGCEVVVGAMTGGELFLQL